LSIEGYRVSSELIERVRTGNWNPDTDSKDAEHKNAFAARGYWQAFQLVTKSITRILNNDNPGSVLDQDHGSWYRELFGPGVAAGILKASDLAGYRNNQDVMLNTIKTEYSTLMSVITESTPVEAEKEKATVSENVVKEKATATEKIREPGANSS